MPHVHLRSLLLTCLFAGAAALPSAAQNFLHTRGLRLVDGDPLGHPPR